MKKLIMLLCAGLVAGAVTEEEYGRFYRASYNDEWSPSSQIILNAGERLGFSKAYYMSGGYLQSSLGVSVAFDITFDTGQTYPSTTYYMSGFTGPCTIDLKNDSSCLRLEYTITRHEVTASPMNIVALPGDNNGDVELLVEASTDLMSWTPVYSGSAGTANNAAFIRTRLIQN